ncbi:MAG: GspH/FimT family pseudopilin [Pseudomonadota bacterium]|nr:GspH/FimT family pseudopilin [Pseudomonadota bacterium]
MKYQKIHVTSLQGFTLIELMTVVLIVAIVASIGAPSFQKMVANRQAERLRSELQLDISFARSQSVTFSDQVTVTPLADNWDTGWQVLRGTTELRNRGSADNPMADSGTITSADFSTATPLTFDRQGRATTTGSIRILVDNCYGDRDYTLSINQIGQIVVAEATCP